MKKCTIVLKQLAVVLSLTFVGTQSFSAQTNQNRGQEVVVKNLPKFKQHSAFGNFRADFSASSVSANDFSSKLNEWLDAGSDHSFQLVSTTTDELGIKHYKYQHFYKNVKVQDDLVLLHEKDGKLIYVNGEFLGDLNFGSLPQLNENEVKTLVSQDLKAQGELIFTDFEFIISKTKTDRGVAANVASKINVLSGKPIQNFVYYVDNVSKGIVRKDNKIMHVDTPSNSQTLYKGTQQITVDSYNGQYRLKDNARNIHTLDATNLDGNINQATGELTGATEFTNSTANYTSAATQPAVETHWAMKTAYDYYSTVHNRNSYDGNGSLIKNYYNVDFSLFDPSAPQGYGMNAAALDVPGLNLVAMVYGNGNYPGYGNAIMGPVVGLDVAGHEYSHLIIGRNGNGGLTYQGESGALNESIADMLGTAIEFKSGQSANWTIGEDVFKMAPNYMRSLSNPNSGPALLASQQPDTYNGTYWASTASGAADNGGVHTNSGVGNYWFYLLSVGGSGTNDIGNAFSVSPITIQKAEKIVYRTLTNYLTPNSQYIDMYNGTKQAVTDLYGASGNEQLQNVKAWYAVGIGDGLLAVNEAAVNNNADFTIYPNPAVGSKFSIETNLKNATYEILDASGKLINNNQKLSQGKNTIALPQLKTGVYVVKVTSDNGTVSKKLIVK